jgi:ferric-dicitrate binding protein FerR (iron transport regulator)
MNEQFEDLVFRHFTGTLSIDGQTTLAKWLESDAAARRLFVERSEEQTELVECFASIKATAPLKLATPPTKFGRPVVHFKQQRSWWPATMAACLLIGLGCAFWFGVFPSRETVGVDVAEVVDSRSSTWKTGDVVRSGFVEISGGQMELLLNSGSRLVLQGECRVELGDEGACRLLNGRVTASVPKADSGFTIEAPGMRVVDVGTEFGVESDGTATELHVLLGAVMATPGGTPQSRYLDERSAVKVGASDSTSLTPISYDPDRFIRPSVRPGPKEPAMVHYSFDEVEGRTAIDQGSGFPGGPYNGTIKGGSDGKLLRSGRFGNALELDGKGMVLKSSCPGLGSDRPRTVAMWVKLPNGSNDSGITRGLAAWGDPNVGGGLWLVGLARGGDQLFLRTEFSGGRVLGKTILNDGEWHHVASVYSGDQSGGPDQQIHHYIDGRLEVTSLDGAGEIHTILSSPESNLLSMGDHPYHADSTTHALLDEFYLIDRALSPAEIQSLFQKNHLAPMPSSSK